jgi:protoporphyrin/coproporphyrin ferrochelatase
MTPGALTMPDQTAYDALILVSFGGPEKRDDVLPFLENVLRGRNVPRERMLEVAEHYYHFDGVSPINAQNRDLIEALRGELAEAGVDLPIYWGNRNWQPLLPDTVRQMRDAGVRRALAFFTSAFSSYSGCRQYRENVTAAREAVGPGAPEIDKLRSFYNHPGFLEPMAEHVGRALGEIPADRRESARIVFTAHSIPSSMAAGCRYEAQLGEASKLVAEMCGHPRFDVVYQSRSGPPTQPWLGPDIGEHLRELSGRGVRDVVVVPIGFISDHMEVLFDLDYEAKHIAEEVGIAMRRVPTVGTHPRFVRMIRELIQERLTTDPERLALGMLGPSHDVCPVDCCPPPQRPAVPK